LVIKGASDRVSVKYSFGRGVPKESYANPVLTNNQPEINNAGIVIL
jgi:hypothetical protein